MPERCLDLRWTEQPSWLLIEVANLVPKGSFEPNKTELGGN